MQRNRALMEMNALSLIFACLVGAIVFVFGLPRSANEWFYVRRLGKMRHHLPPGDMGWPFVGTMLSFGKSLKSGVPNSFISSFASRYGPTGIYRTVMFCTPSIIVCTSEMCRRALSDEENFKMSYPLIARGLVGPKSFHDMSNAEHKYYRRLTATVINSSETLPMYIRNIEGVMTESLEKWSNEDGLVEFSVEMKKPAFKVLLSIFCGSKSDYLTERIPKLFDEIRKGTAFPRINFPGFKFHRAIQAKEELEMLLRGVLNSKKSAEENISSGAGRSLMDILMDAKDEEGQPLSNQDIIDLVHMYLFAGFDPITSATMASLFYLHENPDIMQKLKDEQVQILKRRDSTQKGLSFQELKQMEYLSKVINEMLRMQGGSLFREAKSDVTLNGYLIPKGWKVLVVLGGVHLDPEIFANPREFDPSRWDNHKRKGGTSMPFGAGSRLCPGSDLAKLQISIFLHHFLLNYELERVNPGCPIYYVPGPTPSDNFLVRFKKLKSD